MSAATTLSTALAPKQDPHAPKHTREQRQEQVNKYLQEMLRQDKFMEVGKCRSTGKEVTICYQTHGDPANPCLLLVQGLGTSLAGWPLAMIDYFVSHGFYVIRYDNRDIGRSTHFNEFPAPCIYRFALPLWASIGEKIIYTLEDMMEDGIGLLKALGIAKAHVYGMSMGGMLVSLMAIHHPEMVLSLNIYCSHMGGKDDIRPGLTTYVRFVVPPKSRSERDQAEHLLWIIGFLSQGQYRDVATTELLSDYVMAGYKRDGPPDNFGNVRHISAILRAHSRRAGLRKVRAPTLVQHGALDPLIPVENGKRMAATVPGAKLVIYPNLGHDLPEAIMLDLAAEVVLNMRLVRGADSN